MELFRDSKTKSMNSNSKKRTKCSAVRTIPRKCAEVFQREQGGLMYLCLFCGEDFSKALELEDHLLEHLINILTPPDTAKEHISDSKKTDQVKEESFELAEKLEPADEEDFGVFIKTEPYTTELIIEEDVTIKESLFTEVIKCDNCKDTFYCQGLKDLHNREKHKVSFPYNCELCNAVFNEEDSFNRHKDIHGILNNPACNHCKQIFEFQSDLNEHLQQADIKILPTVEPKQPRHSCDLCGATYLKRLNYLRHSKEVHGISNDTEVSVKHKLFCCDLCPFKTKEKSNFNAHRRVHTKERPFGCNICGKKFAQSSYVKIHKRIHTGEKPFICDVCGLAKTSNKELNIHIKKKHLNVRKKVHWCTLCDKKYYIASHLKNHMRTHTGEKPFKCATCNATFTAQKILSQHKKIHESIKAHECKYCGAKFAQHAGKRGHERRVHEGL